MVPAKHGHLVLKWITFLWEAVTQGSTLQTNLHDENSVAKQHPGMLNCPHCLHLCGLPQ